MASNQLHAVSETYSSVAESSIHLSREHLHSETSLSLPRIDLMLFNLSPDNPSISSKCSYDPFASPWLQLRPNHQYFVLKMHFCRRCKRAIDEVRSTAAHLAYLNSL
eukprot:scaffold31187_cov49-Cyclotella_meneghiniana.AAC.3